MSLAPPLDPPLLPLPISCSAVTTSDHLHQETLQDVKTELPAFQGKLFPPTPVHPSPNQTVVKLFGCRIPLTPDKHPVYDQGPQSTDH